MYGTVYFDLGLWVIILIRLPVISICRFRCVCKSWNSLISSSFFINRHINPPPVSAYDFVFLWNYAVQPASSCLSYGLYNLRSPPYHPRFLHIPFRDQTINHFMTPYYFQIVNIVHGVVCLTSGPNTVLWNPIIRKYREIPRSPLYAGNRCRVVGLGFGPKNHDFKVVCVVERPGKPRPKPAYQVFSTHDGGSWGEAVIVPENLELEYWPMSSCYSNGAIYWLATRGSNKSVLFVFDCEHEEFKTKELPSQLNHYQCCEMKLYNLHGMLLIVAYGNESQEPEWWALEGVAITWKKMAVTNDCEPQQFWPIPNQSLKELMEKNPDTYPYAFEESLHLLDAKSYLVKEDQRGLVYYVVDRRRVQAELFSTLRMLRNLEEGLYMKGLGALAAGKICKLIKSFYDRR